MHLNRPALFALTLLLVSLPLAFAACGDDDDSTPAGTATLASVPPGPKVIDQDNLAFKPTQLVVYQGEKVTFKNSESAIHTVTINGENESGTMKKGDIFEWAPDVPGRYAITCDFHPQMKATIIAVPLPTPAN